VAADSTGISSLTDVHRGLNEAAAADAALAAAGKAGIALRDLRLLRLGSNVVFVAGDVLVRVAPASASRESVGRSVDVARWLEHDDVPAVEALDVPQPIEAEGLLVTFWRYLGAEDRFGSTVDLARLLRRLHALRAPAELELPPLDPFERAAARVATAPLGLKDRAFLAGRLDELRRAYAGLRFELEPGVVHGDASVGNVLVEDGGVARLIDLDGFAVGPREWDLILTAIYYDRYGWHTAEEYAAFCETYGVDVMAWDGYEVLADVREILMVTWLAWKAVESPTLAAEAAKRVEAVRSGSSRRDWQPI
jgi:aminoglycoside phosphotransferase (APT) family kinase protein